MIARTAWVCYLTCSYVVLPVLFRLRFGRWPYAYDLDRRDLYTAVDLAYGSALALYTVVLLSGAPPKPVAALTGLATMSAGLSIQVLAVLAMGRSWRFGQDPNDESVEYVSRGPFRWFRHPIYTSLLIVAVGQGLLVGADWRSSLLVATTLLHFVLQSQAEKRHWGWRGGRSP